MNAELQGAFRALADPSRRTMLRLLGEGDMTIGEVSAHFGMTRAAIKKHLTVLEQGKLISVHPRGRERFNRLEPLALKQTADWLGFFSRYWDTKLGRMKVLAEAEHRRDKVTATTIRKSIFIAAPREIVWDYLTRKDKLALWFHPAESDLEEGKPYALLGEPDNGIRQPQCWGTVLTMRPPATLEYTFTVKPLDGVMTNVRWTLEEALEGTRLSLEHEGIEAAGEAAFGMLRALDAGWDQHLDRLRQSVPA